MGIPVICDRCRVTGLAGEADFSHLGDLLEFTPVPRQKTRVDGWTAERQRALIAALSATGSKRRAALAIGMAPYGVEQLLKGEGSDSFKAAIERAVDIAAQNGSMKIARGVADAAARNAQLTPPSRLRGLPSPAGRAQAESEDDEISEDEKWAMLERIVKGRWLTANGVACDWRERKSHVSRLTGSTGRSKIPRICATRGVGAIGVSTSIWCCMG